VEQVGRPIGKGILKVPVSGYDYSGLVVVIVNWCKPGDTIECIHSLNTAGIPINQVLVVDNGSTDGSLDQLKHAYPNLPTVRLDDNHGFAGGYNYGIKLAIKNGSERILILNNDTVVDEIAVQVLLASKWDISVPIIYFYEAREVIWSAGARWRKFPPMVIMNGYMKTDDELYYHASELEYATGCALMVRREVFEKVGFFDEQFKNYFEDYDFIYRARNVGYKVGFVPEARVWHKVSRTLGRESPRQFWYLGRNSVLFYLKDRRFSAMTLAVYLGWVTIREILKLNFRQTVHFWRGVSNGLEWIRRGTRDL
jgi:GT2 family glycosyltransferase